MHNADRLKYPAYKTNKNKTKHVIIMPLTKILLSLKGSKKKKINK